MTGVYRNVGEEREGRGAQLARGCDTIVKSCNNRNILGEGITLYHI